MAWDPTGQRKFVSRKFKFALDENYHLDKIRGEKKEKKKLTLNVWTTLIISIAILVIAFILPRAAGAVITRRHTDAFVSLEKTRNSMIQTQMGQSIENNTVFVIEQGGKYYLFWYRQGARLEKEDDTSIEDLVEISAPEKDYPMPINVEKGQRIQYPFTDKPITVSGDKVILADGLQLLSGYEIHPYEADDELQKMLRSNVKIYSVKAKG